MIANTVRAIVATALLNIACSSALQASAPPTPSASPTRVTAASTPRPLIEQQLAIIDENRGGARASESVVRGIRQQMDRIQVRCQISDGDLSDAAVQAQNILRDKSINERLPVILASWNDSLVSRPATAGGGKWTTKDCVDILTIWVFLRTGQR